MDGLLIITLMLVMSPMDTEWIFTWCRQRSGRWDRSLNTTWMLPMRLADTEWISTQCRRRSGVWAIEYYIDDVDGLGGH